MRNNRHSLKAQWAFNKYISHNATQDGGPYETLYHQYWVWNETSIVTAVPNLLNVAV